jgi:hypothetical protein
VDLDGSREEMVYDLGPAIHRSESGAAMGFSSRDPLSRRHFCLCCDETVAARPTAAIDAKFGNFVIDPGFFTRLIYEGVVTRAVVP